MHKRLPEHTAAQVRRILDLSQNRPLNTLVKFAVYGSCLSCVECVYVLVRKLIHSVALISIYRYARATVLGPLRAFSRVSINRFSKMDFTNNRQKPSSEHD